MSTLRRLATTAALACALTLAAPLGSPAEACACGGFASNDAMVPVEETALIEIGDGTEVITLRMGLAPKPEVAAPDSVAFVMPVPSQAEFALAEPEIFDELDALTRPLQREKVIDTGIEIFNPFTDDADGGAGGAPEGATVLSQTTIGPYDVVQLTGESVAPVQDWLAANGFALDPALGNGLGAYLAEGWAVVAVKLTADAAAGTDLAGALPPMRISFATDAPVYPMRLSAAAQQEQRLRLYVLAGHRYDAGPAGPGLDDSAQLIYAQPVAPADLAAYPTLSELISKPGFLTRYDISIAEPAAITSDIALTQATSDETYHEVITTTVYRQSDSSHLISLALSILVWLVLPLALVIGTVVLARRHREGTKFWNRRPE